MSRKNRFTLVELLIVIAIIAILTSMLMPALSKARDKAKAVGCLSNLKQLGAGMGQYLNDFSDYLPNPAVSLLTNDGRWCNAIGPQIGYNVNIFKCPVPEPSPLVGNAYRIGKAIYGKPNYGFNGWIYQRPPYSRPSMVFTDASGNWLYVRMTVIKRPSQCVLLADTDNPISGTVNPQTLFPYDPVSPYGWRSSSYGIMSIRHNKGGNFLWFDGHVDWQRPTVLSQNQNYWFGAKQN